MISVKQLTFIFISYTAFAAVASEQGQKYRSLRTRTDSEEISSADLEPGSFKVHSYSPEVQAEGRCKFRCNSRNIERILLTLGTATLTAATVYALTTCEDMKDDCDRAGDTVGGAVSSDIDDFANRTRSFLCKLIGLSGTDCPEF